MDMLTGLVPGTEVVLGMSRRLFAACADLAIEEDRIRTDVAHSYPQLFPAEEGYMDEVPSDRVMFERQAQRRAAYGRRQAEEQPLLRLVTRRGFDRGRESSWTQLLDAEPRFSSEPPAGMLEAATTDTYLAVDTTAVVTSR
jgi:hypothetical protein